MKRIRVRSDFADTVARAGLTMTDFAASAGVNRATLYALINPSQHPKRRGGMLRATAWKLAKAYAAAGVTVRPIMSHDRHPNCAWAVGQIVPPSVAQTVPAW